MNKIQKLEAENARLREALEDIVHCIYGNEATFQWVEKKAREALKGGE
jgi:predicted  nucleic acid-binding Zn-ribbon protein